MPLALPQLSYNYSALEPAIDAQTMEIHYQKHHATYVEKLNTALADSDYANWPIEKLLIELKSLPTELQSAVRNHGGGHYNHSLWWKWLSPTDDSEVDNPLLNQINKQYGSMDGLREKYLAAATGHFGSGWAWLVCDNSKELNIITTSNQDSPISQGLVEIMGIDIWEHAYYLRYQNKRADYLAALWPILNWQESLARYQNEDLYQNG